VLLSDSDIRNRLHSGSIVLDPRDDALIQPASVDVRLGNWFLSFHHETFVSLDPAKDNTSHLEGQKMEPGERLLLTPGAFVLASTVEKVKLPLDVAARLNGKSSLGRLGLVVHATAGFIDPGFHGQITLEMTNVNILPIWLTPGMLIGQLEFEQMLSPATQGYGSPGLGSKYQGQLGPTPSRSHL
jgi:dCTP deaminase